jgi:hypothetical protein
VHGGLAALLLCNYTALQMPPNTANTPEHDITSSSPREHPPYRGPSCDLSEAKSPPRKRCPSANAGCTPCSASIAIAQALPTRCYHVASMPQGSPECTTTDPWAPPARQAMPGKRPPLCEHYRPASTCHLVSVAIPRACCERLANAPRALCEPSLLFT